MMKFTAKTHLLLILFLFALLSACTGGANLESLGGVGGDLSSPGEAPGPSVGGAVGQGQPTIQPGPDHQPGIPDDPYDPAPDDIAIPPPEPSEDPEPGFGGPSGISY